MTSISAVIITKNEALNIRECLESICWVDEIIIVDSGSTDETLSICEEFTTNIFVHAWLGFGPQKNLALSYATSDWILSIDADERVSAQLRKEVIAAIQSADKVGYAIPRLSSYCGKLMHHSGWRPDYVVRLFLRKRGRFSDDFVHERLLIEGEVGRLKADLIHYSFRDLEQVLDVINRYSSLGARKMQQEGKRSGLITAILHGLSAFVCTYVLRRGFLDGRHGLMLAISNAEGSYYKYLKLMELNRMTKNSFFLRSRGLGTKK